LHDHADWEFCERDGAPWMGPERKRGHKKGEKKELEA